LKRRTGRLAVGVIDRTTAVRAVYDRGHRFRTASIVKVDILATLLLQHQAAGTPLSAEEQLGSETPSARRTALPRRTFGWACVKPS